MIRTNRRAAARRLSAAVLCASFLALSLAALLTPGCNKSGSGSGGKLKIAVIPKGMTHDFWKSVEAGARRAGQEQDVEILWKGPLTEEQTQEEIDIVNQFIADGVSGIAVAPLDSKGLRGAVKAATGRKIPVVIFDSALEADVGKDFVAFVGTNNRNAGKLGGEQLLKVMGGKGKVVLLRYNPGSASTDEREAGFLGAVEGQPGIEMLSKDQYAGAKQDTAKEKAQNMLDVLRQADGIFCPNESSTLGMVLALRQAGLTKGENRKKIVGFDATAPEVAALEAGEIDALVAQNPEKMGHDAVVAVVNAVRGKPVGQNQDTGAVVITRDNLNSPEVKALLKR